MKIPFKTISFALMLLISSSTTTHAEQDNIATNAICQAAISVPANYTQLQVFAQEGNDLHCNCLVRQHTQFIAMDKTIVNFYDPSVSEAILEINSNQNAFVETVYVSPLYIALSREDYGLLRLLMQNGINLNQRFENGMLPIELALHENRPNMVYFLLNHGANIGDIELGCPHNFELTRSLVQLGANPMTMDLNCMTGNEDNFQKALELMPNLVYRTLTQKEVTSLFKSPKLLETMLQKGLNVNQTLKVFDKKGNRVEKTFLIQAIENQNEEAFDLLLKHGASVNMNSTKGWTPIFYAVKANSLALVRKLILKGASVTWISEDYKNTPLNLSVELGLKAISKELLESGAKPFLRVLNKEDLPLTRALNNRDKLIIDLLLRYTLRKELDIDHYFEHETILHQHESLDYVLSAGLRPNDELLKAAILGKKTEAVTTILKHKERLRTANEMPEIYEAFEKDNIIIATELIKNGTDVNMKIKDKNPLLIQAIEKNSLVLVVQLLDNGANPNSINLNGKSSLNIAITNDYDRITKLLLERNAGINCDDILLTIEHENVSILKLLKTKLGKLDCKIDGRSLRYHTRGMNVSFEVKNMVRGGWF